MGISFSCSGDDALDQSLEAILRRITLGDVDYGEHSLLRSVSFNGHDAGPTILKSWGSGKLIIKGYLSFNMRDHRDPFHLETKFSITAPSSETKSETFTPNSKPRASLKRTRLSASSDINLELDQSPKYQAAAVKLQKVYKSFRTRRQLADCAVLVEQRWWKLLDFALLKRNSVSFFDIKRPESVISKWSRAKSRAAKVGKGLSKNNKAQKLALQHWLEAIDPRHRYGHNLHFYYDCWLRCKSRQPFFYWLDVGEGKEISLEEKCSRSKLQQQCIKYLGPKEREVYEVVVEDGKFSYKKSRQVLDTSQGPKDSKWIFVLSTSKTLYVGQKKKGRFQHSSFLAGGATSAAGRLEVDNGILKAVWPHSGHYRPTEENFQELLSFLKENNVDLTNVKESPSGEEEELWSKVLSSHSEIGEENEQLVDDVTKSKQGEGEEKEADSKMNHSHSQEYQRRENNATTSEEHYMFRKPNLFVGSEEPLSVPLSVPSELILRRMNSKKGLKSLQLGKQLSCKWTTGAGPRIGCVRDYPSELQARALEQVCLSPRSSFGASRFGPSLH